MSLIDLSGKTALVTGVADNVGFAWHIAKVLAGHNAEIILSSHPRVISIVERFLTKDKYQESRLLLNGDELKPKMVIPCDVSLDKEEDLSTEERQQRGYEGNASIAEMVSTLKQSKEKIDIVIHSVAFSPEIKSLHLDVSRRGYLTAMSVSSYSLIALTRAMLPFMDGRNGSIIALSYLASERAVPFYGGGMASAKAALECDARMLSWQLGEVGHRINIISAGPYASRAAKSIGDMEEMVLKTSQKSPLRRAITADEVSYTALFLASDMSKAITGETIHVDAGFHAMALV
jgi:enoyl-[acyl-carrier protein] reductase I